MERQKRVLICPLDWGLGHATRMTEVAFHFQNAGWEVLVAGSEKVCALMAAELSNIKCIDFKGVNIKYPFKSHFIFLYLFWQVHLFLFYALKDYLKLKSIVKEFRPDLIISDSRPGAFSRKVYSIYVTHQIRFSLPKIMKYASFLPAMVHKCLIRNFNECWIPDNKHKDWLAGELSHAGNLPEKYKYIGFLSRFHCAMGIVPEMELPDFEVLLIASGPQPQRDFFIKKIAGILSRAWIPTLVLAANPECLGDEPKKILPFINFCQHLTSQHFLNTINRAEIIITRAGYSSLMDFSDLNKRVIFIPTPGQPEQIYLAKWLSELGCLTIAEQHNLEIIVELIQQKKVKQFRFPNYSSVKKNIDELNRKFTFIKQL